MPSHLGLNVEDPRPNNVSHLDVLANDRADHFAGIAAKQVEVSNPIATNHIYYVKLVKAIRRRLALIILNLPPREHNKESKPLPVPKVKLSSMFHGKFLGLPHHHQKILKQHLS